MRLKFERLERILSRLAADSQSYLFYKEEENKKIIY